MKSTDFFVNHVWNVGPSYCRICVYMHVIVLTSSYCIFYNMAPFDSFILLSLQVCSILSSYHIHRLFLKYLRTYSDLFLNVLVIWRWLTYIWWCWHTYVNRRNPVCLGLILHKDLSQNAFLKLIMAQKARLN